MAIEVGNVLEGRVTGVKPFGAFVALPEGKSGMVHISEVSNEYVQDIATVAFAVLCVCLFVKREKKAAQLVNKFE